MRLKRIHHIAIICSDYERSKAFYTQILGLEILQEVYRKERDSYKLDLGLDGEYIIELFSFPNPPKRLTRPEATGLRHLAFEVEDVTAAMAYLDAYNIDHEGLRIDEHSLKQFTFLKDPDGLPIELYEL